MKRLFLLLILIFCGCSSPAPKKTALPTPTPEMLIQKNTVRQSLPTPTLYPIYQTMTASVFLPVQSTPVREYHQPQNINSPTPRTCRIKGNVSWRNNDEKIYHCPNWRDYDRTEVNTRDGDRWFCTEAEAIAAGFRKPQNVSSPCIP